MRDFIDGVLRAFRGGAGGDPRPLDESELDTVGQGVLQLRQGLTGARELAGNEYLSQRTLGDAYLLYHAPLNYARARAVLTEVTLPEDREELRILDIGAGPGPLAQAALDVVAARGSRARAVMTDRSGAAVKMAQVLAEARGYGDQVTAVRWALPSSIPRNVRAKGPYDILLLGNVLNELWRGEKDATEQRAEWLAGTARKLVRRGGAVVIIEPALRETGRDLLALHDVLVEEGFPILAPCLHQGACPALERKRDWCHQARRWEQPELVRALSARAGVDNRRLNFSYAIFQVGGRKPDTGPPETFRVVSAPIVEKGKRLVWGCGSVGRHRLVRLDRDRSDANAAFDDADRGDVLTAAPLAARGDGQRIGAETEVRLAATVGSEPTPLN